MAAPQKVAANSTCVVCEAKIPPLVLKRRFSYPLLRKERYFAYVRSHSAHALRGDMPVRLNDRLFLRADVLSQPFQNTVRDFFAPIFPVFLYPHVRPFD
jgi:hypothetical protein